MKSAIYAGLFIGVLMAVDIAVTLEHMKGWFNLEFDFRLVCNVQISVILSALSFALIMWIYVPGQCCTVPEHSVCDMWCCACLDDDLEDFSALTGDSKQIPIMLQD